MIQYNFLIDKNTYFAYWVQTLIKWTWLFEKKNSVFYNSLNGEYTEQEKESLDQLKEILQKKENAFLWLWKRYAGEAIEQKEEEQLWESIQNVFSKKFERVWKEELPLIERWQGILADYPQQKMNELYIQVAHFLNYRQITKDNIIDVKLCPNTNPLPGGHAKKEFPHVLLLDISRVDPCYFQNAIMVLAHETIHLFEYEAQTPKELLKQSFHTIIVPRNIRVKGGGPHWHHLFMEAMITSIASKRMQGYGAHFLFGSNEHPIKENVDVVLNRENYNFQIRIVAEAMMEMTQEYLEQGKIIDSDYCDAIATEWVRVAEQYWFAEKM